MIARVPAGRQGASRLVARTLAMTALALLALVSSSLSSPALARAKPAAQAQADTPAPPREPAGETPALAAPDAANAPAAISAQDSGETSPAAVRSASKPPESPLPESVSLVADWVATTQDNGELPYIIIDKQTAALFLYDPEGNRVGKAPVLIGVAKGDEATPGVGSKDLARIGPAERTTPAGRFVARYGLASGPKQRVLWVDYANSVALHPLVAGTKKERRRARLLSPRYTDNRITFGCINVPVAFYANKVQALFGAKGGVVYILPDTKALADVFPRLRAFNPDAAPAALASTASDKPQVLTDADPH